jgi:hypothetical protein
MRFAGLANELQFQETYRLLLRAQLWQAVSTQWHRNPNAVTAAKLLHVPACTHLLHLCSCLQPQQARRGCDGRRSYTAALCSQ